LKPNGQVVDRTTVRPLEDEEWNNAEEKKARDDYDLQVKEIVGEFDGEMVYDYPPEEPESTFPEAKGKVEDIPDSVPDNGVKFDPIIRAHK
jgi:hypothetical protein